MQRGMSSTRSSAARLLALAVVLALAGCPTRNPDDAGFDGGRGDTGSADVPATDAPGLDTPRDGGLDAPIDDDGGTDAPIGDDSGTDAPITATCGGITEVREAAAGTISLVLSRVLVTYTRPAIGDDPAGFFVQCDGAGPAVLVAVDPATTTPVLAAGDRITFTATSVADAAGSAGTGDQDRVTAITGLTREASGVDVEALSEELSSSTDVVTALDGRESALVTITGTIEDDFFGAGDLHSSARFVTAGVDDENLVVRLPDAIRESLAIRVGCEITVGPSPLWRFDETAQVMGYDEADITVLSCPPVPSVAAGAVAITEIAFSFAGSDDGLEFIEILNPGAAAVDLSGCVLTDAGSSVRTLRTLTVPAGGRVIVGGPDSETDAEAVLPAEFGLGGDDAITLTCGSTVVDTVDWGVAPFPAGTDDVSMQLDPGASTAADNDDGANWCVTPAGSTYGTMSRRGTPGAANVACPVVAMGADVRINELNAHITGGCDLVEIRVVAGGSMGGFVLRERTGALFAFPDDFSVATNDIVVVHTDRADMVCTGGVAAPADETTMPNAVPAATVSTNFDTAFDFYATDDGITDTDNVLWIVDTTSTILDAVLVSDDATGTAAGGSEDAAATVAAAGEWTTTSGTVPTGGFVDDAFSAAAVLDLGATGTSAAGESIRRTDDSDTNHMGGWAQGASTFGVRNAGQSAL